MKRHLSILCGALLILPIGSAKAADKAFLGPSSSGYNGQSLPYGKQVRIRLVTPGHVGAPWQSGTLVFSADSVVLHKARSGGSDARVAVPLESTDRMQVRTGSKGHSLNGFIIGGSLGLIGGAAAGVAASHITFFGETSSPSNSEVIGAAVGGAMIGGVVLGGLGAIVGALIRTDQWEEVPLDRLQVGMTSGPKPGPALAVTLRF